MVINDSALPSARSTLINWTPTPAPINPPESSVMPILKSTLPKRKCAATADEDAATIWQESEAAATVGGIPTSIRMGVSRNPPPTPSNPDRKPTSAPAPTRIQRLIVIPAIGKKIDIASLLPTWNAVDAGSSDLQLCSETLIPHFSGRNKKQPLTALISP